MGAVLRLARRCETREEFMTFIQENGVELIDEQLEHISGGHASPPGQVQKQRCTEGGSEHKYVKTGRKKPGRWIGIVDDVEKRCTYCGKTIWALW